MIYTSAGKHYWKILMNGGFKTMNDCSLLE